MQLTLFGIPAPLLTRWIIEQIFPDGVPLWADLGMGNGEYIRDIGLAPEKGIGVDVSEPRIQPQNFAFEKRDILEWLKAQPQGRLPLISMFDVVEHFEKEKALKLMAEAEGKSEAVLISTPSGFLKQDAETHPEDKENPWNWHRSGFSPEDLESLGYAVFILRNAHYKPAGNKRSFDKLVALKARALPVKLFSNIKRQAFLYNLKPINLLRTLRDSVIRPVF